MCAWAQGFVVKGASTVGLTGQISLYIYDQGANPRQLKSDVTNGAFSFSGSVKGTVYAELSSTSLPNTIPLFLENSEITVTINNKAYPRITGSRANSSYRYALEMCDGEDNRESCLLNFVRDNPNSPVAPYIIVNHLMSLPFEQLGDLCDMLAGPAVNAYHYRQLKEMLGSMAATREGSRLPDFLIPTASGEYIHFDSIQKDSTYVLLLLGATWCAGSQSWEQTINGTIKNYKDIQLVSTLIDKDERQWDSPLMKTLAISHIPFVILIDPQGRTLARDVRVWELDRVLKQFKVPYKK